MSAREKLNGFLMILALIAASAGNLPAAGTNRRLDTDNPRAITLYEEGLKLAGADRFNEAVDKLRQAIMADSNFIQAHLRYMDAFKGAGRGDEVSDMYRNKVEQNPRSPVYHYLYGRSLNEMPAKRAEFQKAQECDSSFYWASYGIGGTYYLEGRQDEAVIYLGRALKMNPQMTEALKLLGDVYMEKGMFLQAKDQFEKAAGIDSMDVSVHLKLGQAFSRMERYESAEKAFFKATAVNPGEPQPWYFLGLLFEMRDDTAKAVEAYRKFIAVKPDDELVPLVQQNIEALTGKKSAK
jgi:tetratricopeptide (TPR) repeat protein